MESEERGRVPDHLEIWINAAAQLNPAASFVAALINGYVSSARQKSIKQMIGILFQRFGDLGTRIDAEVLQKDDFSDLFNSCLLMAARTTREDKVRVAAEILSNCLLKPGDQAKLGAQELDFFAKCVDGLSIGAIDVLGTMYRARDGNAAQRRQGDSIVFNFGDIQRLTAHTDVHLLMGLIGELSRFNLVHLPGAPTVTTPRYGNYPVHLTHLGLRFAELMMNEKTTR